MKTILLSFLLSNLAVAATRTGEAQKVSVGERGQTTWTCKLTGTEHKIKVTLSPAEPRLEVEVDGTTSRGFAVETKVPKEGIVYYAMTNGGYPYHYEFTLTQKTGKDWALFKLAWGADDFVCETP